MADKTGKTPKDYEVCADSPNGKHQPEMRSTHITYDHGEVFVDVNCLHCGQSGCFGKFTKESEVDW